MQKTPAIAGRRLFVVILEAGSHTDPEATTIDDCIEVININLLVEDVVDGSVQSTFSLKSYEPPISKVA